MEFQTYSAIGFCEVERRWEEQYPEERAESTKDWTVLMLREVNRLCASWGSVRVCGDQLGDVLLPWHVSRADADYCVIPQSGMLLSEVAGELDTRIKENAPNFIRRISELAGKPSGHIFLSEVMPKSERTYSNVVARQGHLVCLDGLHRLAALGKSGLTSDELEITVAFENLPQ